MATTYMIPLEKWIQNGTVWENDTFRMIVLWIDGNQFGLLSEPYKAADHPGTAMMFRKMENKLFFTQSELADYFARYKYRPVTAKLLLVWPMNENP